MSDSFNSISPNELRRLIGRPDCPPVIDVRRRAVFDTADTMIPGARWCDYAEVGRWVEHIAAGADIIVYCVHGHNVSQAAIADLRRRGFHARAVAGGIEAYAEQGGLLLTKSAMPPGGWETPSRWITRERPKIDRIACPWLIKRFIDPLATFHYVPADAVFSAAETLAAIPFDIPGAVLSHRGENCSFDAMIEDFALTDPALHRLADIVRGADTSRLDLTQQSAGLYAISLGLSDLIGDDQALLAAGMPIYDALYRWQRDLRGETHNWPPQAVSHAERRQ